MKDYIACFNLKNDSFLIISDTAVYASFHVRYIANQKGSLTVYHHFLGLFLNCYKIVLKPFKHIDEEERVVR